MSRYKFFWLAFAAMFVWSWVPGYFAKALSAVSILCLITTNKTAKFLGSAHPSGGVGLFSFSFDWSMIGMYGPIATPWWATVNWFVGNVAWQWIVVPICYYMNVWGSPVLQSAYKFDDGTDFGLLNNNKIFNRYFDVTQHWIQSLRTTT
jgi:OPT oligopeptide transporter protein